MSKLKISPCIKKNFVIFLKNFLDEYLQVRPKSTVLSHYHDRGFLASQSRVPWTWKEQLYCKISCHLFLSILWKVYKHTRAASSLWLKQFTQLDYRQRAIALNKLVDFDEVPTKNGDTRLNRKWSESRKNKGFSLQEEDYREEFYSYLLGKN